MRLDALDDFVPGFDAHAGVLICFWHLVGLSTYFGSPLGELSAKPTEGRQAPLVQRIVIEWIGGELFGIRLHGVVLVADVLALVQREFRQTHTVLGREGLQEVGLVVVERSGVVAVEVGDAQATVWGVGVQSDGFDQTVERR